MQQNKQTKTLIMQCDVGGCLICISYKLAEYLNKERSYKNSTKGKEVILLLKLIFPMQSLASLDETVVRSSMKASCSSDTISCL